MSMKQRRSYDVPNLYMYFFGNELPGMNGTFRSINLFQI